MRFSERMNRQRHTTWNRRSIGVSLIETVIALLILGGAFVAALNTIGGARASQRIVADQRLGLVLAEDLLAEVLSHPYAEPGTSVLGVDLGEVASDRSTFDDIDDYHGWSASPPQGVDDKPIEGAEGYTRSVEVVRVQLANPASSSLSDQGMKRVVVTVRHGEKQVAQLIAYRSDVYDAMGGD